jgi:hypothetical protein
MISAARLEASVAIGVGELAFNPEGSIRFPRNSYMRT